MNEEYDYISDNAVSTAEGTGGCSKGITKAKATPDRTNSRGEPKTSRYNRPKPQEISLKTMELVPLRRSGRLSQQRKQKQTVSSVML